MMRMTITTAEKFDIIETPIIGRSEELLYEHMVSILPKVLDIKSLHEQYVLTQYGFKSHEKTRQMIYSLSMAGRVTLRKYGKHVFVVPVLQSSNSEKRSGR